MSELIFSFSLDHGKQPFLALTLRDAAAEGKTLFASTLLQGSKHCKELYAFLIDKICQAHGISVPGPRLANLAINTLKIPAKDALACIRLLALSRKLLWAGKTAIFDPFSFATPSYLAQDDGVCLQISVSLRIGTTEFCLRDVEFVFPFAVPWLLIAQRVIAFDADADRSLISKVFSTPSIEWKGKEREEFLRLYADDEHVQIVDCKSGKDSIAQLMLPRLFLKDPYGATADLYMDYGDKGLILYQAPASPLRLIEQELSWEKDLLETGYQRKKVGEAHYFCPLDKVTKTLSFLLEIGWHIVDFKGRRVCKKKDLSLSLKAEEKGFIVQGSIEYQDHKVDLQDVIGSFSRRERFIELVPGFCGLIEDSSQEQNLADLGEADTSAGGIYLKKGQMGLIMPLLAEGKVAIDQSAASLIEKLITLKTEVVDLLLEGFSGALYPYQQEGVRWLKARAELSLGALLADDMGLGKTVQVLALIATLKEVSSVLIVAPTSLIFNWKREIETFLPGVSYYIHQGKDRLQDPTALQGYKIILTSYAYLRIDSNFFASLQLAGAVLDEAQWIKNPQSQLAKAAFGIKAKWKIAMTGTPVENSADDLWSLFYFLEKELLGSRQDMQKTVSSMHIDSRHRQLLTKKIKPFLLRRTKDDVGLQLPEKVLQTVYIDMTPSQRACYEASLVEGRHNATQQRGRLNVLKTLLRLRQICCHPSLAGYEIDQGSEASGKLTRIIEDINELVQAGSKVLVFSQFTSHLKIIKELLDSKNCHYVYLDGSTDDRQSVVNTFQTDPAVQVFLMSLKAGGVGLNLTAADYVFLCDPWWNEAAERQAIDRAYRLGRKGAVVARRYVTAESIEEKIMHLKEHKHNLSEALLAGAEATASSLSIDDLIALLD